MIDSAKDYQVSEIFDPNNKLTYRIPKYQREYSWAQAQWQALVDDLLSEDAENGHFLGMELPRFDGHLNFGGRPQKEGAQRGPSNQISLRVQN